MKKFLAVLLLAVLPTFVNAADLTGTAVPPTQYTNNEPIATSGPEALQSLRFEYGSCVGTAFGTKAGEATVLLPAVSATWTGIGAGTYCIRAFAKLANGTESATSNIASQTILTRVPAAPKLTASVGVAYTILKQIDRFVMLPIGTIPSDTPCDPAQSVNGYNVVPRSAVTWAGDVKPDVVVAQCS